MEVMFVISHVYMSFFLLKYLSNGKWELMGGYNVIIIIFTLLPCKMEKIEENENRENKTICDSSYFYICKKWGVK